MDENEYKPCHCGHDCDYKDNYMGTPCWGQVNSEGLSGDDDFGHYCEGHAPQYYGEPYKEKPG